MKWIAKDRCKVPQDSLMRITIKFEIENYHCIPTKKNCFKLKILLLKSVLNKL